MSVVAYYCAAGHGLQYTAEVEAPGLLARRKFTETLQPLPNIGCRRGKNEGVVDKPAAVVYALIFSTFEGITSQVGDDGGTQFHKRLPPDFEAVGILSQEGD